MKKHKKTVAKQYFENPKIKNNIVDDVTQLNPIKVKKVFTPKTQDELIDFVKKTKEKISIWWGRFSMGGQTASVNSVHIDMRELNNVVDLDVKNKLIKVESWIRWCDIQKFIDPKDLSIKIMQTYANFTVWGSLSVNVHWRYIGLGPLILSVKSIKVLLADWTLINCNRKNNIEIFNAVIWGYSFVGIILETELELDENVNVKRVNRRMKTADYFKYFKKEIRKDKKIIFHNADLYPPHYNTCNAVSWVETNEKPTTKERLQKVDGNFLLEKYYFWVFSETKFGKLRREKLLDPILFAWKKIHTRNYESWYSVSELEPISRKKSTYVLQEYFVPVEKFDEFTFKMWEIYRRYNVNIINVSIRHAYPDLESNMSWARKESFAFVIYHKQDTDEKSRIEVGIWHRELMDLVSEMWGSYYLPYQPHASFETFKKSYPNFEKTFKLKKKLDPELKIDNVLINKYYKEYLNEKQNKNQYINDFEFNSENKNSDFHKVFFNQKLSDSLYLFLQNIYHLYPEKDFFSLIYHSVKKYNTDKEIYNSIQKKLPEIKTKLSDITYWLPALKKQKRVIISQLVEILNNTKKINWYLEIWTTGRHIKDLKNNFNISWKIYTTNFSNPDNSLWEIFERWWITKVSKHFELNDYEILTKNIEAKSIWLVFMPIWLHHIKKEKLELFIESIAKILRKWWIFILRDHNAYNKDMKLHCSNIHTVFNLGLNISYKEDKEEYRNFNSIEYWSELLSKYWLEQSWKMLLQDNDPTLNTLVKFIKK